jgi:predicted ester cyclase
MSDQNAQIVRHLHESAWNHHDLSVADQVIAPDHDPQGPFTDDLPNGPAGYKAFVSAYLAAFPDIHMSIERQEAQGDRVRTWQQFVGTHTGPLMNIPPTGRKVSVQVVATERVVNGMIVESVYEWDAQDFLRQLGVG